MQCLSWQRLLRFYEITRMETAEVALAVQDPRNWLATIVSYGVNLIWPTDNNVYNPVMALEIEREFRPLRAPIKYVCQGKVITTRTAIRIGPMYMMLLEKTGDDWSACSSTKTHFHGVPAQTSMADKYRTPARETGVRFTGEAEVRILVSYIGPEPTMELLDRNANPIIHGVVNTGILEAERCGDIGLLVDRHKYPYGGSKPLQMVHHLNTCAGWAFDYKKAAPTC
jgi:hypothetical protein